MGQGLVFGSQLCVIIASTYRTVRTSFAYKYYSKHDPKCTLLQMKTDRYNLNVTFKASSLDSN